MNYRDLIGCKYKLNGRSIEEGFDCYGILIEVYARNGIEIYDPYKEYENMTKEEGFNYFEFAVKNGYFQKLDKIDDLCIIEIAYNNIPMHVGVHIGEGLMIHSSEKKGVVIEPVRRFNPLIKGVYKVSNSKSLQISVQHRYRDNQG